MAFRMTNGLLRNFDAFECPKCHQPVDSGKGITFRGCVHLYCEPCLVESIKNAPELEVHCPGAEHDQHCDTVLRDDEIRALLTSWEYNEFRRRREPVKPRTTVRCLTPGCVGWAAGFVDSFQCSICSAVNCVSCQMIHIEQSCQEYHSKLQRDRENQQSEEIMEKMLASREALRCPTCSVFISKVEGCDYVVCTVCKAEICWPTQGLRWGPGGHGDTSGGCRCKVDEGKMCHPDCIGCH